MTRVVVTGLGCVSALGQGVEPTWSAVSQGHGGIRHLSRRVADDPGYAYEGPAAYIDALDPTPLQAKFGPRPFANLDPLAAYALAATHEALGQSGLIDHPALIERTAIVYGGGSGGNQTLEEGYHRLFHKRAGSVHPMTVPRRMLSGPVSHLSILYGVRGLALAVSSACSSSANAVIEGMHMIRAGRADVVIVGGTEAPITYGSWSAWVALKAMAPDACRPFSIDRKGLVIGEGAATLVLESHDHARARGAHIHAEIVGGGVSSDAHHITAPHGDGAVSAIRQAHADALLPLDTPLLVSAHGTGTLLNDRTEAQALRTVYGEGLDRNLVIATKSAHGHLFGAGGALELVIGILALKRRIAPPILNWLGPDPECDAPLALEPRDIAYDALLSNAFAFGGLNAVILAKLV